MGEMFTPAGSEVARDDIDKMRVSLRDYFAAKALAGILSNHYDDDVMSGKKPIELAKEAYLIADAMLKIGFADTLLELIVDSECDPLDPLEVKKRIRK